MNLFNRLKEKFCKHEFNLNDLHITGIPEIPVPIKNDYKDYTAYYQQDAFTKRVSWKCQKCGKVFYAHCGLDISLKYGYIVK